MQYKVPKQYVAAVIGRGGLVIKNIEDKTGTHINMRNDDDIDSQYRVCTIRGKDVEDVGLAESMIKNIIDNQPVIETYEFFISYETFGAMLKRNANIVQQMQRFFGAKLILENGVFKSEAGWKKRMIIKGTAEQIASVVTEMEDKIREENQAQAQLKCEQVATVRSPRISPSKNTVKDTVEDQLIKTDEFFIPHKTCEKIIGRNGNTLQQIQKVSGANIAIGKDISQDNERTIVITGTSKQIELAITQIKKEIEDEDTSQIKKKDREENEIQTDLYDELAVITKKIPIIESSSKNSFNANPDISEVSEDDAITLEVYVSAMETPNVFWIHVVGPGNNALDNLVSEMTEYYNKEENRELHALKKVTSGQMVAAKFSYDNKWYRAEVVEVMDDSECEVFFVDFGDLEVLFIDNIFELRTDMLSLRLQAVECSLANTKPSDRESEWSPEACSKFAELVHLAQWKSLIAKIKGYKERPISYRKSCRENLSIPCIDLYDKDGDKIINIRETLISLELAQFEEEVCLTKNSTLLKDKHDLQTSSALSSTERVSNNGHNEADFTVSTCKKDN